MANGKSVMEGARANGVEGIVAECGGACSCATCHVYVDPSWTARLPTPGDAERDLLDFATCPDPARSRLSCQLIVTPDLDGLIVEVADNQS